MLTNDIICPVCKDNKFDNYKCPCGYVIEYDQNVIVFPSNLVNKFKNYSKKTNLESYNQLEPNPASEYYPRYVQDDAKVILDIGGGDGLVLANYAKENPNSKVYVIDADFNNIKRVPFRKIENLVALNCSATSLPFDNNSVDTVFTVFAVEHMYDYDYSEFLFEVKRVLKKGGRLVIATDSDIYDKWIHPIFRIFSFKEKFFTTGFLEKWNVSKTAIDHHNLKSPRQTETFVKKHGFFVQDIRLHLIGSNWWLGQILYETIIPKILAQKILSTMYVLIARQND
ncbi:MAG: hypothetical protein CMG63_04755 [Candidatus Marinimicrobia bacterium]|nr:hypothetical protein [Candidatus Neomarinimicrobiota bacterium]|tara:strand:- start:945 stop:1793 length:849 start_codon:yes stop_codon:yes gene_type:complete